MKCKVLSLISLSLYVSLAHAGMYRWIDDDGKVNYSDSVPPSKSQRGHAELDESGMEVETVLAAKSKEVVEEEKWLAELSKQLEEKQLQQTQKDSVLLNSFATLEQFDSFRDEKLKVLEDDLKQLKLLRGKLLEEFERLNKQLKNSKSSGAKKRVRGFIETNQENTDAYDNAIRQNEKETKTLTLSTEEQRKRLIFLLKKAEE
uniref:DUF4124 domain-containing protein n=1 Tax=uncultured Thiotrichaceae bacterium TaxID=298394 RepID=A0A6S6SWP7_9GAMM|nr:MAG: Unknown protein [uncultured Thiotrichaceae bacterium]